MCLSLNEDFTPVGGIENPVSVSLYEGFKPVGGEGNLVGSSLSENTTCGWRRKLCVFEPE